MGLACCRFASSGLDRESAKSTAAPSLSARREAATPSSSLTATGDSCQRARYTCGAGASNTMGYMALGEVASSLGWKQISVAGRCLAVAAWAHGPCMPCAAFWRCCKYAVLQISTSDQYFRSARPSGLSAIGGGERNSHPAERPLSNLLLQLQLAEGYDPLGQGGAPATVTCWACREARLLTAFFPSRIHLADNGCQEGVAGKQAPCKALASHDTRDSVKTVKPMEQGTCCQWGVCMCSEVIHV
jgi:hypothetical protein